LAPLAVTSNTVPTDPSAGLHRRRLPLVALPRKLIRLSLRKYPDPHHWSKLGVHRFDSPAATYGVLYTSNSVETAILEVFGDQWRSIRQVRFNDLEEYDVCELGNTSRSLMVVNATGKHLNRLGTDSNFFAATDYATTQSWARSFMTHPQEPAGIRYNSRKNPRRINYALFGTPETKTAIELVRRYPLIQYASLYPFLLSYDVAIL
jgi:RES domain